MARARLLPAVAVLTIMASVCHGSIDSNTKPLLTRASTLPLTPISQMDQQLEQILTKLDENHEDLDSSITEVKRIVRRTQREVDDLQRDMELLLGKMYKPSCMEIAQDQHEAVPGRTNDASIGVFIVKPPKSKPTEVRCEIERGAIGWTVMLSRTNGRERFNRTYREYQEGFGDTSGEYWIGNDFLHKLTTWRPHQLRVVMEDWDGQKTWVQYNRFSVASPSESYKLTVDQYEADSAAGDGFNIHNGMTFSTYDKDDDQKTDGNCAQVIGGGGGWWYNNCYHVLPTGRYRSSGGIEYGGVAWYPWRNVKHSLKAIKLLLRRTTL